MSARYLFVPVLALALAGCEDPDLVELDEDLGTEIATDLYVYNGDSSPTDWTQGHIAWSSDSREIFYLAGDDVGIDVVAVDVETATTRVLTSNLGETGIFRLSHDGEWLYFYDMTVDSVSVYARVAVEGGTPEHVMVHAPFAQYALSPDGAFLAFGSLPAGDPVALYDIAQGTTDDLDVVGLPLRYSPDGSELLVTSDSECELSIVSLEDGTASPLISYDHGRTAGVHWEGNRIEIAYIEDPGTEETGYDDPSIIRRLFVADGSGSTRAVTEEGALDHGKVLSMALSPDGTRVALWLSRCIEHTRPRGWPGPCLKSQAVLYLVDIASGSISTIGATQTFPEDLDYRWWVHVMAFSPDGRYLAYTGGWNTLSYEVSGIELYVKAVP
jgi:Tol biopolymer transport system component